MTTHDQYAEDLTLHAIGVLEGGELAELRQHLEGCDECREELERLRKDMTMLVLSAADATPPARARQRLLSAISPKPLATAVEQPAAAGEKAVAALHEKPAAPLTAETPSPSRAEPWRAPDRKLVPIQPKRSVWAPVGWLAAAAATVVTVATWQHSSGLERQLAELRTRLVAEQRQLADVQKVLAVFNAPQAQHITLVSTEEKPQPQGKAIYVAQHANLVFLASNLPPLAKGSAYELWLIPTVGSPLPAGVFTPDAQGNAMVMNPPLPEGTAVKAFAVTVEPSGGSAAPTSKPMLVGTAT